MMKTESLIVAGIVGLAAYFLLKPKVMPKSLTTALANQYYPGMQMPLQIGAQTCPPGYYLAQGVMGTYCAPIPSGATVLKASEDMVYVDGKLVPVSQVFG